MNEMYIFMKFPDSSSMIHHQQKKKKKTNQAKTWLELTPSRRMEIAWLRTEVEVDRGVMHAINVVCVLG